VLVLALALARLAHANALSGSRDTDKSLFSHLTPIKIGVKQGKRAHMVDGRTVLPGTGQAQAQAGFLILMVLKNLNYIAHPRLRDVGEDN
jgi:hypothetical protein